jgi:hypothetical protein
MTMMKRISGIWISPETLIQHKEKSDLTLNRMHLRRNQLKNLTLKFKLWWSDSENSIWRLCKEISEDSNSEDSDHAHFTLTHAQKHAIRCHLVRNLSWKPSNCSTILLRKHLIMLLVCYGKDKEFTTFVSHNWHKIFIDFPPTVLSQVLYKAPSQLAKTILIQ